MKNIWENHTCLSCPMTVSSSHVELGPIHLVPLVQSRGNIANLKGGWGNSQQSQTTRLCRGPLNLGNSATGVTEDGEDGSRQLPCVPEGDSYSCMILGRMCTDACSDTHTHTHTHTHIQTHTHTHTHTHTQPHT